MWLSEATQSKRVILRAVVISFTSLILLFTLQPTTASLNRTPSAFPTLTSSAGSRGYLTTPEELRSIAQKANLGVEPYKGAVDEVLNSAAKKWDYKLDANETCKSANSPAWIDNERGIKRLYARALAYHLTGNSNYAEEVRLILEQIMTNVLVISLDEQQCRLNFGWGTPELVASADLIEDYWYNETCTGPLSLLYGDTTIGTGKCKELFQNWLVKNPYYVISYSAEASQSNWGAAATTTLAYIADYLWDRPDVRLEHRNPDENNSTWTDVTYSPAGAYDHANQLALDRMNGYRVDYGSSTCDNLAGPQQSDAWPPVKSQITERGIITEDARREEYCNIPNYNGDYQNYPQVHIGNNIQQCELMLRRGDRSCYDNIDYTEIPNYTFTDENGDRKVTYLYPGRGSLERAINSIIVDSHTEWRHDAALEVAYRYYAVYHQFEGVDQWAAQLDRPSGCSQDICFGTLTHGFAPGETPGLPPTVPKATP
ncbi:MAG TPA: hypothetical protein VHP83_02415 [Aggregatilineaceae bacterium]|nr:hypothetical protein [Aggregatilineaceae bacterium]